MYFAKCINYFFKPDQDVTIQFSGDSKADSNLRSHLHEQTANRQAGGRTQRVRMRFNRNLGLKHDNLIKELLRCGECGSRFSVGGGGTKCRKYKCYGTVCRADKQRTCLYGAELYMKRLDGLVLQINAFNKMKTKANIIARQEEIRNDRPLVKEDIRSLVNNDSKLLVFDKSSDLFLASPGSEFYNVDGPIDKSGRHVMDFEEFKAKAEMLHFTMNYPAYVYEDNEG